MTKLEETLARMEEIANDVKEFADRKLEGQDEALKEKVNSMVDKTANFIKQLTIKVNEYAAQVNDDEKLNAFLNNVIVKVQEASDFTKMKISELIPEQDKLEEIEKEISDAFDKFIENESVQTVVKGFQGLSEQVSEYFKRPEVKARINNCKKAALNAAEKGMEELRRVLAVEEEAEEEIKEAPVEKIIIEDENEAVEAEPVSPQIDFPTDSNPENLQ